MQREVKFLGVNPMALTAGAVEPLLCSSWRFGFNDFGKPDGPLYFGLSDSGPLVAMAAVESTIAALRGENKVLRDLLRAADNVLDTVDEDSDASAEGLQALRASIAYALTHSLPDIMEYAKVVNGGTSDVVTTSREVLRPNVALTGRAK